MVEERDYNLNSLTQHALSRKQKLNALIKRRSESNRKTDEKDQTDSNLKDGSDERPKKRLDFRFRNYDPTINGPKRHDDVEHSKETVEESIKGIVERVKIEDEIQRASELIQPKKPNWDLKRDLTKKLNKLDPITQAAFATLIRKRMQTEGAGSTEENAAILAKEINTAGKPNDEVEEDLSEDED
ncbi:cwf18 pre-mRNA splicing factor-domain-containing protein [Phakopsora pachyrhizi]|nr:cwf18 pre-mRNA splicing factor-domain-containing protein [Phakopsora pachyrhizi]